MDEAKLSKWTLTVAGSSYLILGLLFVVLYAFSSVSDSSELSLFTIKSIVIAALYAISIFLVATLPNKHITRRLYSWGYSIVFHVGLLIYIYYQAELGFGIFVMLIPELVIAVLVTLGLCKVISSKDNSFNDTKEEL